MVGTVKAITVAIAPVIKMDILMTHMISCSEACCGSYDSYIRRQRSKLLHLHVAER